MNIFKKKKTDLDMEIDAVLDVMRHLDPAQSNYENVAKSLKALYEVKATEKSHGVSGDTWLVVLGSLVEVFGMLYFEKIGVVTSKVLGRILRGRV